MKIIIPSYIKKILQRSQLLNEPYKIKIYGNNKVGGEKGFIKEIEKLINWCKRYYAEANITENGMWYTKYTTAQSAYNHNHHNYFVLEITDPVMNAWERNRLVK